MKKFAIEIKWGIQYSLLSLVWMIFEKTMGWHDQHIAIQPIYTNLFGIVAVLIYFLALLDKKKNFYLGTMDWKQGFITGIALSFVISLLSPIVQYVTYTYLTPTYFTNSIQYTVSHKKQTLAQAELFFSLKSFMLQGIFGGLSMGVLTSAIVALLVKTKK